MVSLLSEGLIILCPDPPRPGLFLMDRLVSGLVVWLGEAYNDRVSTLLPNNVAALAYGKPIIRELKDVRGYDEADLKMIAKIVYDRIIHVRHLSERAWGPRSNPQK
jgi:hypothetical protein